MPRLPRFSRSSDTPDRARGNANQGGGPKRNWRDVVEEQLEEARERGDFEHLEGAGKPFARDDNPFAGDRALAYRLLKNNNLTPPEIERGKEIDGELAGAEKALATLRRQRDALHIRVSGGYASERRAYNAVREKTRARYADTLRAVNSKILSLNIVAPPALHRRLLDVEARLRAFDEEFPRVEEK